MDYWAKDIYSWGIFSAEVYPRSSIDNVWFSDEAHFLLSGHVNSKNNIFWGSTPPEHCLQRPLHSVKCTAWVAISKHGIIGPFWFEDDNERSVTISTERYVQVLGKFCSALSRRRGVVRVLQWFQQDGTTHHTSNESLAWLQQRFPDRLYQPQVWPAGELHSPDLNPQIFICGHTLRTACMATNPRLSLTWKQQSQQQ